LAKGIRVNQLAKELGVESKEILKKLREEGLGDKVPNHMSTIALGLAESVREWFAHGSGGTAVETAPPVEATKLKRTTRKKKAEIGEAEEGGDVQVAEMEPPVVEEAPAAPTVVEAPKTETVIEAPAAPEVVVTPAPAVETPAPAPVIAPPATEVPAIAAETAAPVAPPAAKAPGAHTHGRPAAPPMRATVTLESRRAAVGQHTPVRKPVTPAPQMLAPKKATIQGPKVIREEKPDVISAPRQRPRGPMTSDGPSFTQARPTLGRGVKSTGDDEEEEKKKAAKNKSLSSRRRGVDGRRGEAMEKLKEFSEADLVERAERLNAAATYRTGFDSHLKKSEAKGTHIQAMSAVQRGGVVEVEEPITVKSLSAALGIKSNELMGKLLKKGIFASINQTLETAQAEELALDFGLELQIAQEATLEEQLLAQYQKREVKIEDLRPRPPVVTILGHVDHGKTSLLDKIRNANVAAGEAGGITQHTAAWMVEVNNKRVTFIDTPGHQAFTSMRARGANMTDIVVLVVSAVEGVQPQTIESINHAKAAGVPIVVAMNKIDRADANPDMVLGQLAKEGLNPVEWGGETEVVRTSATTGQGIPELIETLDYQAELLELKYDPTSHGRGTVIESRLDEGLGPVATVLVQDGTLHVGDIVLGGAGFGRVRSLWNDRGQPIQEAGASMPVIVSGLSAVPGAGDAVYQVEDMEQARAIAEERSMHTRQMALGSQNRVTAANLIDTMKAGDTQTINLIIKADVQGSVETLVKTVGGQNTMEVKVRVIHSGVGPVTESDVELAIATKQKPTDNRVAIIGFHVGPEEAARQLAEQNHVDVKTYRVIYEIFDDLKKALSGMLTPEVREKLHGHAEVRQVFKISRMGNIAGCMVTDGHITRGSKIRLIRNGAIITDDISIETLKRGKDDAKEVKTGFECGIKLAGYDDIKVGDVLEAYIKETFERTL